MKKIAMFSFLLIPLFTLMLGAYGQEKAMPSAEERATKLTNWMKTNLKLTDDQVTKIQPINLKYANKMNELKASTQDKNVKMQAMKADDAAKDSELKAILTPDQYSTYQSKKEELKKEMSEKMKEKKGS